jgi:hypothetical protein
MEASEFKAKYVAVMDEVAESGRGRRRHQERQAAP